MQYLKHTFMQSVHSEVQNAKLKGTASCAIQMYLVTLHTHKSQGLRATAECLSKEQLFQKNSQLTYNCATISANFHSTKKDWGTT